MNKGYIYRHWIVNDKGIEKSYIGMTTQKPKRRWNNGKSYLYGNTGTKFKNAILKYGWENFTHDILEEIECDNLNDVILNLKKLEIMYIELYNSFECGYNSTKGGDDVGNRRGAGHVNYRKKFSKETRKKISDARKKYYANGGEHSKGMKGKTHSEEYKERLRREMPGSNNRFYGKHHSDETKAKISSNNKGLLTGNKNPSAKSVICIETGEIFGTMKDACEKYGLKSISSIVTSCKTNGIKGAGKDPNTKQILHWLYVDKETFYALCA